MFLDRNRARRDRRHRVEFRPEVDCRLETRALLSTVKAALLQAKAETAAAATGTVQTQAKHVRVYINQPKVLTMRGGKGVRIQDGRGGAFNAIIDQGPGTITAVANKNGTFSLTLFGTNADSELVINPLRPTAKWGTSHTFQSEFGIGREILEVGDIEIKTGKIGSILGYRTANLWGTVTVHNDSPVNRIAFNRLMPGATIRTDGDLETLDIFTDANLAGDGTGIFIGRDLDWMLVGGDLRVAAGAKFVVSRDLGLNAQEAKGSDPGGKGATIQGNVYIGENGAISIERALAGALLVQGNLTGASRFSIDQITTGTITVLGDVTAT